MDAHLVYVDHLQAGGESAAITSKIVAHLTAHKHQFTNYEYLVYSFVIGIVTTVASNTLCKYNKCN